MAELITKEEEDKLESALKRAGQILMDYWPGNPRRTQEIEIFTKADNSPVTSADLASNEIIVSALHELFPGNAILSEEIPESHGKATSGRLWVLDPLDGTRQFIGGHAQFGILLGLCVDGQASAGYIYAPAREFFMIGSKSSAARYNGETVGVSRNKTLQPGGLFCKRRGTVDGTFFTDLAQDHSEAFLLVCQGRIDALVARRAKCGDWDLAAPAAIVGACGGILTDETGERLKFGSGKPTGKFIIISNQHVHAEVMKLLPELENQP